MELYAHQQDVIDWTDPRFQHLNPKRFGLFFAPRTGKTYILSALLKKYNIKQALIIVPKAIKEQWKEHLGPQGHIVMTKEEFRRDYKILPSYEAFIFDEAHHASNIKSQLTKACLWYLKKHNPQYRWLATGTPYRSSPMSIFGLGQLLGMNWNYWTFFNTFYQMIKMGARSVPVLRSGMEDTLEEYVRAIGMTLKLEDVVDTEAPLSFKVVMELTDEQKKIIKDLNETVAITRFTKIHEIEQGFFPGDEYVASHELPSHKQEKLREYAATNAKMIIVCRYTFQIDMIAKMFSERKVFIISGATKDKGQMVKDIEEASDCIVIIQSACCEGYDLSSINTMVFASMSFSHSDHIQMKDRMVRLDRKKVNVYYYLIGGKVDEAVYKNIMAKLDFHMQIFSNDQSSNFTN